MPSGLWEIDWAIGTIRYFATLDLPTEVLKEDTARKVVRLHKPLGVVAAITPWNFPVVRKARADTFVLEFPEVPPSFRALLGI